MDASGTFRSTGLRGPKGRASCTATGLSLQAPHAWQGALELEQPFTCSALKQGGQALAAGCPLGSSVTLSGPGPAADRQFQ